MTELSRWDRLGGISYTNESFAIEKRTFVIELSATIIYVGRVIILSCIMGIITTFYLSTPPCS